MPYRAIPIIRCGSSVMHEVLKYLGEVLRRTYGAIVETPMPWRMIDKLATLEEREEQDAARGTERTERTQDGGGESTPRGDQ